MTDYQTEVYGLLSKDVWVATPEIAKIMFKKDKSKRGTYIGHRTKTFRALRQLEKYNLVEKRRLPGNQPTEWKKK